MYHCTNYRYVNCSNCHNPFPKELWCKRCDPYNMIKEGNPSIDKFIKYTIYNTGVYGIFLRWIPFEKFKNMSEKNLNEVMTRSESNSFFNKYYKNLRLAEITNKIFIIINKYYIYFI